MHGVLKVWELPEGQGRNPGVLAVTGPQAPQDALSRATERQGQSF